MRGDTLPLSKLFSVSTCTVLETEHIHILPSENVQPHPVVFTGTAEDVKEFLEFKYLECEKRGYLDLAVSHCKDLFILSVLNHQCVPEEYDSISEVKTALNEWFSKQ